MTARSHPAEPVDGIGKASASTAETVSRPLPRTVETELETLRFLVRTQSRRVEFLEHELADTRVSRSYRLARALSAVARMARAPRRAAGLVWRAAHTSAIRSGLLPAATDLCRSLPTIARRIARAAEALPAPSQAAAPSVRRILAERRRARLVNILVPTFFDADGNNMFYGGAERYLIEFATLLNELGFEVNVYQYARGSWVRHYGDVRVSGIDTGGDIGQLNRCFHEQVEAGALTVYFAFHLAFPQCHGNSIGISHGIYWNHTSFQTQRGIQKTKLHEILRAFELVRTVVSVDTNTLNWLRATHGNLASKCVYVPNFVDLESFAPSKGARDSERLVLLYPRRLYAARGYWLLREVLADVLEKFPQVDAHFVDKADSAEEADILHFMARFPGRVHWYWLPPERMGEAYGCADITLIPTVHSEGTSLSCLEAQASGSAVIATNIGGLADLVLHGFNGLLIEPVAGELRQAIEELVSDDALRARLSANARSVAQTFSVGRWRNRWERILADHLPPVTGSRRRWRSQTALFLDAPGITWGRMMQRPHQLAWQLATHGIETYWVDSESRKPSPHPRLHVLAPTDDIYLHHPIVIVYYPYHYERLKSLRDPFVVYDVLDDVSIHAGSDSRFAEPGKSAKDFHEALLHEADLVTTSSNELHDQLRRIRPDIVLAANGVDLAHFKPAGSTDRAVPAAIADLEGPLIGYHGAIADWFDRDLLYAVAVSRPTYRFVLIGPVSVDVDQLRALENVRFLGELPYADLPWYLARFSVGLLPFQVNRTTLGVRPLKVLEYLAMHKRVVSTPLPDLLSWPGVATASTATEFARRIDDALAAGDLAGEPGLDAFLRASSWQRTSRPLLRALLRRPSSPDTLRVAEVAQNARASLVD